MATTELLEGSPLNARIDGVEREIANGNLWVALPGLKTLLAEAQMSEDEEALQRIAVLAVRAEDQNADKTRRALGDELERLRGLADGAVATRPQTSLGAVTETQTRRQPVTDKQDESSQGWVERRAFGLSSLLCLGLALAMMRWSLDSDEMGLLFVTASAIGLCLGVTGVFRDDRKSLAVVGTVIGFLTVALIVVVIWAVLTLDIDIDVTL